MTPQINSFLGALPQLLPKFTPIAAGSNPVAKAGGDPNALVQQLLAQPPQQNNGGFSPELLKTLIQGDKDQVNEMNRTSNVVGGAGNPFNNGFFKPMDQAFQDTGNRGPGFTPGGVPVAPQPQTQNPFAVGQQLIPGQQPLIPGQGNFTFGTQQPRLFGR